ncbi:MAG TPA: WxcM-like domain-containing protein [Patescibacteria group bacterium]
MPYQEFEGEVPVQSGEIEAGSFRVSSETTPRLIDGVRFLSPEIVVSDSRRTLSVVCNSRDVGMDGQTPLVYVVVIKASTESGKRNFAGNHYHSRRLERIQVVHGCVEVVLCDYRSGAQGRVNILYLSRPDCVIEVPPGVAHAFKEHAGSATLVVHASCDYDPTDDIHVDLTHI